MCECCKSLQVLCNNVLLIVKQLCLLKTSTKLKTIFMKTKRKILLMTAFAAFSLAAILGGCKKDDFVQVAGVCPIVLSTDPANLATNVALNKVITVTFNEKMNPATITNASITISGASAVSGTRTYSGTTATVIPSRH